MPNSTSSGSRCCLLHEGKIGPGQSAGRRPGIAARDQGRGARIGRGADIGRAQVIAVGFICSCQRLARNGLRWALRMQARMHVAVDDPEPGVGGASCSRMGRSMTSLMRSSLDVTFMRRDPAAERFRADCRRTCAKRYWQADAAVSRRRRRIASADSRTRTGASCPNRSGR